jgi:hypothetical protein
VLGFEVLVLRFMFRGAWFPIGRNKCWVAIKTQLKEKEKEKLIT